MLKAFDAGVECIGILKEWNGFMENLKMPLSVAELMIFILRIN
jgi:hypothetical protein